MELILGLLGVLLILLFLVAARISFHWCGLLSFSLSRPRRAPGAAQTEAGRLTGPACCPASSAAWLAVYSANIAYGSLRKPRHTAALTRPAVEPRRPLALALPRPEPRRQRLRKAGQPLHVCAIHTSAALSGSLPSLSCQCCHRAPVRGKRRFSSYIDLV